jgi:NAD(P)-dependent dehydrogenase (short-subunit alcohol dehydrogenase family)
MLADGSVHDAGQATTRYAHYLTGFRRSRFVKDLLNGKVALITGAGSGLGRAAAMVFSSHGAKLLCADINEAAVRETVGQLRERGASAETATCDVASEASVTAAVEAAAARFGRLDIVYNNAGIGSPSAPGGGTVKLVDMTPEQMERLQAINVQGVINGCRAAIRLFQRQGGGGAIINTASAAGLIGWGGVIYGATKGAVIALTRALAMEVAPHGIRVNSVCPGVMLTNFGAMSQLSSEALDGLKRLHPLGRMIDPTDTANAALFLASDLASNITGVNLPVDGGITAGLAIGRR